LAENGRLTWVAFGEFRLVKNNGVSKLIVVVNKMDDPTVGWAKER
jgi:translation elongation factor EF-1alpha